MISLVRVDRERNMDRWYMVTVQATLFDEVAVICGWGRRGTEQARWRIFPMEDRRIAEELAAHIVRKKIQRGYQRIEEQSMG